MSSPTPHLCSPQLPPCGHLWGRQGGGGVIGGWRGDFQHDWLGIVGYQDDRWGVRNQSSCVMERNDKVNYSHTLACDKAVISYTLSTHLGVGGKEPGRDCTPNMLCGSVFRALNMDN